MPTITLNKWYKRLLRPEWSLVWHPDRPDIKIGVVRTWVGRLFKPRLVATSSEVINQLADRVAAKQGEHPRS